MNTAPQNLVKNSGPSNSTGRIDWVDYAKGFCIILVVMMHSTLGVEKAADQTGWLGYLVEFARPFRMPDFFLISGLFLGLVIDRPWRRYFDRKVVHFFYFYALWVTIQFAFKAPLWFSEGATVPALAVQYLTAYIEPFGTLWFIYMLPIFFIVTRFAKKLPWWILLGAAALLQILPIHTGHLVIDEFASRYVFFVTGYLFADRIFDIAAWVKDKTGKALLLLAVWAVAHAVIVFAPVPEAVAKLGAINSFAELPLISLILGGAGALAIIAAAGAISKVKRAKFFEYLGRNSIVVYLAFFLPMAVSRTVLLKFASFLDIGTISVLVTFAGVSGPVILYLIIQRTGWGKFLFERPAFARFEINIASPAALNIVQIPGMRHPAE